ncbi:MAG: [FeFe] hydrogenase H-cluster radical SAM maturase HydE [Bacteroidales bacterium]|nr:[FeFe] hydrogenase H-cluster radical SAM maturase HydE [Bacteroidales bacterium]MBN2818995.1 [FeFe] hydrogenase H-cluster radical SAM maturase HydE [Bacteroidales bacterium]
MVSDILKKNILNKEDLVILLQVNAEEKTLLFEHAAEIKKKTVGNIVYFRGLIEFSNICAKNCFYCGIRHENRNFNRYNIDDEHIVNSARFAYENKFASLVLQSGELSSQKFTRRVTRLLEKIHKETNNELRLTLSCGEQSEETYKEWFNAGAHRYLLRIESSNPELYIKLHPNDKNHRFEKRLECLNILQNAGYQTGTGVMIGLPFQTMEDLANDLLFMKNYKIDMVGMGPYIEHSDTPLWNYRHTLLPLAERFQLSLKMIALLRILMPEINIASATALQAIDKLGREKALKVGANVIMPNITPGQYRNDYHLYQNKPCTDDSAEDCKTCLEARVALAGNTIGYSSWGDSKFFLNRNNI